MTINEKDKIKHYIKINSKIIMFLIILLTILTIFQSSKTNAQTTPRIVIESNNQNVKKGDQVELSVHLENTSIAAYTIYLYYDTTKLEHISSPENSNNINNFVVHTGVTSTGEEQSNIQISPFIFKVIAKEGIASVIVIGELYNQNGEKIQIEDGMLEIQIGEKTKNVQQEESKANEEETNEAQANQNITADNTNLKILRLDKEGISPSFSPDIKEYYIVVNNNINDIEVTAIPENEKANVKITGNKNLKNGLNTIKITVESEDTKKKSTYTINVTKTSDMQKANTNLENLAIRNGTLNPEFDTNITKYTVELENNIDKIDILAVPESMNAKVEIKKNNTLNVGDNLIEIIVTAEDNITKKKYEIIAHRRTAAEEIKHEEEQKLQEEMLNNILEEKQIDENIDNNEKQNNQIEEKRIGIYIIIPVIALTTILIVIWKIKENRKNREKRNKKERNK